MALKEKLDAIRAAAAKSLPAEARAVMEDATQELRRSGAAARVLAAGASLPDFDLVNQREERVRSAELLARGPLVLTIYRGGW